MKRGLRLVIQQPPPAPIREQLCVSQTDPAAGMTGPSVEIPPAAKLGEAFVFAGGLDMQADLFAEEDLGAPFLQGRALEQMAVIYKEIPLGEQGGEQDDYRGDFDLCSSPVPPQSIPPGDRAQDDELFGPTFLQKSDPTAYRITGSGEAADAPAREAVGRAANARAKGQSHQGTPRALTAAYLSSPQVQREGGTAQGPSMEGFFGAHHTPCRQSPWIPQTLGASQRE
ncbi:hypothetical protein E5288_WYG019157 [Bos mutus]|uniref:Uncharacterized protein n=1 Tax=Bos mutus TaxID=72004 RepID=A0A6B0SAC9_9CETA|nr:hypothetical protein [Bos mutus]